MMDTYDYHQHHHQRQAPFPHYQHAASVFPMVPTHPLPIPGVQHPTAGSSYNPTVAGTSSSCSSSLSTSVHSSPEGVRLEELTYAPDTGTNPPSNASPQMSLKVQLDQRPPSSAQCSPPKDSGSLPNAMLPSGLASVTNATTLSGRPNSTSLTIPGILNRSTPLSRPLTHKEQELLAHLDRLKFFLATAPSRWSDSDGSEGDGSHAGNVQRGTPMMPHPNTHPALNRFLLPSGEYVTCVLWSGLYHITGTDIVRALVFRFEAFGRPVRNMKKFEEGIFSDLRNLKPGTDACLEEPKSPFLDLLFKYQCIRTQKKQKVFYWFSVPHDRLFLDALERDLKREKMGLEPTTFVVGEPAISFTYDPKRTLYEQFSKAQGGVEGEGELEAAVRRAEEAQREAQVLKPQGVEGTNSAEANAASQSEETDASTQKVSPASTRLDQGNASETEGAVLAGAPSLLNARRSMTPSMVPAALRGPGSPFFNMFSLFEGSPNYKQRRKKITKTASRSHSGPGSQGFVRVASPYEGTGDEADGDDEMSAAAMFEAQAHMGMDGGKQDQARKQADGQRVVQQHHLANISASMQAGAPTLSSTSTLSLPDGQFPNMTMHPSLIARSSSPHGVHGQRHTLPMTSLPYQQGGAVPPNSISESGYSASNSVVPSHPTVTHSTIVGGITKTTKAFVCPLFSCGRLFKRMEHLKRHVRTHTMEKPYECEHCHKRFSRSDNLNQHIRTHARENSNPATGLSTASDYVPDADGDDEELEGDDAGNLVGDSIDVDSLDGKIYEVDVGDSLQDIHGDEDGAFNGTGKQTGGYFNEAGEYFTTMGNPHFAHVVTSPENSPNLLSNAQLRDDSPGAQWATRHDPSAYELYASPHTSPAYTTGSSASASSQAIPQTRGDGGFDAAHSANYRMYSAQSDYGTSMSAPSHQQVFDQAVMYPPALGLHGISHGPGALRRYRSATPSIIRAADSIRRPSSSSGAIDYGISGAASRAYHPYAAYASSLSGSNHSSPAPYHAQLDYAPHRAVEHHRAMSRSGSHSRSTSSSHMQEHLQQIIHLDQVDSEMGYGASALAGGSGGYGEMYHLESSGQVHGSAPFYSGANNANTDHGMYALVDMDPQDSSHMRTEQWARTAMS